MSGRGLAFSGALQVKDACIVALRHCRRGFAKLSRYGDRFATDIETQQFPLAGWRVPLTIPPNGEVETLALTVALEDFLRLVKREGYRPEAMQQLAEIAATRQRSVAEWLWELQADAGHDPVLYRRKLFALTNYTSPHYIPHPVRLANGRYGLIFLAPGSEGTGSADVISIRQQTGIQGVMNLLQTWKKKPNDDQLSYFLSCLLGGVHGVNVRDLLVAVDEEPSLALLLRERLAVEILEECERFVAVTNLSQIEYQQLFGDPEERFTRSGLHAFLESGVTEEQD